MSKEKLLNIRMKLANPKIDDILEDYYKGKHDLISVKKDVLLLCDKLMKLAYNQALEDAANNAKIKLHDGHFKKDSLVKHIQMGANNATIDKQSILKTKID